MLNEEPKCSRSLSLCNCCSVGNTENGVSSIHNVITLFLSGKEKGVEDHGIVLQYY